MGYFDAKSLQHLKTSAALPAGSGRTFAYSHFSETICKYFVRSIDILGCAQKQMNYYYNY